jgi:hypothetical protein
VSLADYVINFARGQTVLVGGVVIVPPSPPTTLYAAVHNRGWSASAKSLHATQSMLERALAEIWEGRAVWVPANAPKLPWEPLIFQNCQGSVRLAMGAEAAAYSGQRMELAVFASDHADWLTDQEAASLAEMKKGKFRRFIATHRDVRVGRPISRDGQLAKNRRLVHKRDLRRALRLKCPVDNGDPCKGIECPQRCWIARRCPHRDRDCPDL